jgi:solute carrier family 45, member 1/2/4
MAFGGMNLPKAFPFLGQTQFKVLCSLASIIIFLTTAVSVALVPERDPTLDGEVTEKDSSLVSFFRSLWTSVLRLPKQIARVCEVQFLAWIGWFPFLFYTTTYIGEIYVEPIFEEAKEQGRTMTEDEITATWELATRHGTFALLIFAITTFVASVVLPFMIQASFKPPPPVHRRPATPLTPTTPGSLLASGYFDARAVPRPSTRLERLSSLIDTVFEKVQIPGLTIRRAWLLSHILFAACMFGTFIVRSITLATILVGIIGIPWAVTQWAPFALISAEISKRDAIRRGLIRAPPTTEGNLLAANEDDSADQAGVVLGIHNVAISAPQVISTLISSLIFRIAAKPRGSPGDESVAWCFRFGGLCALAAAYLTTRVAEENKGVRGKERGVSRDQPQLYDRVGAGDEDEG